MVDRNDINSVHNSSLILFPSGLLVIYIVYNFHLPLFYERNYSIVVYPLLIDFATLRDLQPR
jgi:hypothetical protein